MFQTRCDWRCHGPRMARQAQGIGEQAISVMFLKAAIAIVFVWLLLPRAPELGSTTPPPSKAVYSVEHIRLTILDAIIRVRADLKAHRHGI